MASSHGACLSCKALELVLTGLGTPLPGEATPLEQSNLRWFTQAHIGARKKSNGPLAYFWISYVDFFGDIISMGWRKKGVTPLITHWSYIFLALTHRYQVSIGNPEQETGSSIWPKFKHKYPGASHMTNYAKYVSANYAELSLHWALRNDLQWNFNWNQYIFIQINAFENVWKMASILSRPQCVKYPMGRLP